MIPSAFVTLDALPLTGSGKLDRRALPAPALTRPALEVGFAAPRSGAEETLAAIWGAVLRRETVGVHDNFFELGGDSILAIQIIARANQEGLGLSPMQFFAHQTIAELAAVAGTAAAVPAEQGLVTGAVPLMPYQRWFFERQLPEAHHWNIAVLVELQERVDLDAMQRAVAHLLAHHDALRLRFDRQGAGWHQHNAGEEAARDASVLSRVDLSHLPEALQEQAYERVVAELQAGLDLAEGPVIRVGHFDRGGGRRSLMLFVIHHMAVDGISWRILLEDLEVVYRQLQGGEPAVLPAKTTSFRRWAERLTEHVETGALDGELGHWVDAVGARVPPLPRDFAGGANIQASARSIVLTLGAEDTRALLHEVPRAYNTQINDVLLTALAMTFAPWTESPRLLIELEGHGREQLRDDLDLSRTVGCFTALFPVLLELDGAADPGRALRSIKEQLRRIPHHGIGYGLLRYVRNGEDGRERLRAASAAEVSFIYLGQFDQVVARSSLFGVARGSVGPIRSARQTRAYVLDVLGQVIEDRLQIEWTYSDNLHRPSTVETLAERFVGALTAIIGHCRQAGAASYTPSDFPYAGLDQGALDRCLAAATATRAGGVRDVIEDVYALSSTQQGMLFHTLLAPASGVYCTQILVTLSGPLDVRALERAWESVAQRFPVLRSAVRWEELDHPVQVVYRRAPIPLERQDWRSVPPAAWDARFEEYLRGDRRRGIDLSTPPLMRLTLVELADRHYELIWTDHHLLLDAWSGALVLREVIEHYRAFCRGEELSLPPRRPYRDFIAWLAQQDAGRARTFWQDLLRGFTAPTTLRIDRAPASLPASEEHFGRGEERLTAVETEALHAWAKDRHLSLNTVLEGAWALLLSHESGRDDVVFGTVVAGRPAELIGVESMVGLFINTLPMRVRVSADGTLVGWLQRLQRRHVEMQQYEYSSLADIQGWSEVARGIPLFESIFGFENLAVDPSVGALQREIEIANVRLVDWNSYPLSVAITPNPELILALKYDGRRFAGPAIGLLLEQYRGLLVAMSGAADARLGDLLARLDEADRARRRRSEDELGAVSRDKLRSTRRRVVDPTGAAG